MWLDIPYSIIPEKFFKYDVSIERKKKSLLSEMCTEILTNEIMSGIGLKVIQGLESEVGV